MKAERRAEFADYIAEGIRFSTMQTGQKWPDETIVVAKSYSELASLDNIIGMPVFVMDMPSSFDFFVAFPAQFEHERELQKKFEEYLSICLLAM
jgi:hypothetical protein